MTHDQRLDFRTDHFSLFSNRSSHVSAHGNPEQVDPEKGEYRRFSGGKRKIGGVGATRETRSLPPGAAADLTLRLIKSDRDGIA